MYGGVDPIVRCGRGLWSKESASLELCDWIGNRKTRAWEVSGRGAEWGSSVRSEDETQNMWLHSCWKIESHQENVITFLALVCSQKKKGKKISESISRVEKGISLYFPLLFLTF